MTEEILEEVILLEKCWEEFDKEITLFFEKYNNKLHPGLFSLSVIAKVFRYAFMKASSKEAMDNLLAAILESYHNQMRNFLTPKENNGNS